MSKSRSSDSGGGGSSGSNSRCNSVEVYEEPPEPPVQSELNQLTLGSSESMTSAECTQMTLATHDTSSVVSTNTDSTMPASSPPPSYERVLEEVRELRTRLAMTMGDDEEAIEESTDEGETVRKPKKKSKSVPPPQQQQQPQKGQEVFYKSSKDFYRAMAKQWGITCKMSDNCRCLDCQSRYFDCGYDKYQDCDKYIEQSDGGLSASTPMFVSEVMHGSACQIL